MRSSIGVLSGPPAKSGSTCTVSRLQGLEALEWTRVSCTLHPAARVSPPPRPWSPFDVGRAVPSGKTTTPYEADWAEMDGRVMEDARLVYDDGFDLLGG